MSGLNHKTFYSLLKLFRCENLQQTVLKHSLHTFAIGQESRNSKKSTEVTKNKYFMYNI